MRTDSSPSSEYVMEYMNQYRSVTASQLFTAMWQRHELTYTQVRRALSWLTETGEVRPVVGFVKRDIRAVRMSTLRYELAGN